jgi:hypothetical protein
MNLKTIVILYILGSFLFPIFGNAQDVVINEIVSSNMSVNADGDGDFKDWIELYNNGDSPVNLSGYGLSDDSTNPQKWIFPKVTIQANEFLLVWASGKNRKNQELHTNFSIKSSGEKIWLTSSTGTVIDSLPPTDIKADFSVGRFPNGTGDWVLFYEPSPNAENVESVFVGQCEIPVPSTLAGYYSGSVEVSFSSSTPNAEMHYTTNGAVPTEKSKKVEGAISISKTTTLRVQAFSPDLQPSKIATNTYFIDEDFTFPVVSVTTDPYNLYDSEYGIFPGGDPYWESNLFQDWERPIHFQFFETDKMPVVNMDAGVKVHGGLTRGVEGKSLAIMARTEYGSDSINHKFFAEKELASFKNLVLRNGGNDYNYAILRDCFMQELVRDNMDLDLSGSRPAIVFLNGEYWGIRDIKEKMNEHFLARNFNIDTDDIDMLEYVHHNSEVQEMNGSAEHFNNLIEFIASNTLTDDDNYKTVETQIDITNFIEYQVAQIYYDNSDWPGNNIKWWRQSKPESKYRWLLFDTDFGFSLSPFGNETGDELLHYKHNTLGIATDPGGDEWPNPPHSTFLFRSLLENETFRNLFINTFCDHLNTTFQPERVIEILNEYKNLFEPEMSRHRQRFPSSKSWTRELSNMNTFAEKRPQYIYPHLMQKFRLGRNKTITLNVDDPTKGDVGINSLVCAAYPWEGKYFPNVPVTVRAIAKPGNKFVEWSDGNKSEVRKIDVQNTPHLTAIFGQSSIESNTIVINEINYNSAPDFDTDDWVELLNNSESWADIGNWVFKDGKDEHQFIFPGGALIAPGKALVLCNNQGKFQNYNPKIENVFGNMDFNFSSGGEFLRLYDSKGTLIDSVNYGVKAPWPDLSDFEGHTLQLIAADLDNTLAGSWKMSEEIGGNPGLDNTGIIDAVTYFERGNISELSQNYPNPFRSQTTINYQLSETSPVLIRVIDFTGRTVKIFVDKTQTAGNYSLEWNGENQNGQEVKSDIYFLQMVSGRISETKKMIKIE